MSAITASSVIENSLGPYTSGISILNIIHLILPSDVWQKVSYFFLSLSQKILTYYLTINFSTARQPYSSTMSNVCGTQPAWWHRACNWSCHCRCSPALGTSSLWTGRSTLERWPGSNKLILALLFYTNNKLGSFSSVLESVWRNKKPCLEVIKASRSPCDLGAHHPWDHWKIWETRIVSLCSSKCWQGKQLINQNIFQFEQNEKYAPIYLGLVMIDNISLRRYNIQVSTRN